MKESKVHALAKKLDEERTGCEPIVIDNGSFSLKSGISGLCNPNHKTRAIVARPRETVKGISVFVGEEALGYAGSQANAAEILKYPISHGIVTNWDNMQALWNHVFLVEEKISPDEHAVLLTENFVGPKANRERTTQIMFETFCVPAMYIAIPTVLALYASGRTTGLVLDSGGGVTHTAPIYEGYALPHGICRLDVAGYSVTDYLMKLLEGKIGNTLAIKEQTRKMKEELGYVALNFEEEEGIYEKQSYTLPDGTILEVGKELFSAPEVMFQPALIGCEAHGIHSSIYASIMKCDVDIKKDLLGNVVLAGGNTMFPGMKDRIHDEILRLVPPTMTAKVICPDDRMYSAWIGGSILSSLSTFEKMWISSEEYDESGPSIVCRKCF